MAQALLEGSKLRLAFQVDIDEKGNPVVKTKTFSNIKKESTADQLFQVALAISALCNDPLNKTERSDSTELTA
ncbi:MULTISPECIES: DUF1659 domain-containing protein [Neobacillus]|uniref:DUF1659 domain-containing protein n=1 Tax=Neobacillus rhizophilus TaxID=2833579 RepID=A0A942YYM4_9BACI|nr:MULTISPECIES: DUF1659 domain-containing protein [Neobacillus]MBS4215146.1 DUF1659 domain-containing protein [Neobacillus rhizophilus]MBU8919286.1 DUF1659 domain-containing protein [Bacillus sp. FJAT-29953]